MKLKKQPALACPIDAIGASARLMVAFSGFYESPGPLPSGDVCGVVLPHHDDHRHVHQSGYMLHRRVVCCLLSPWRPPGRYGASSCPEVVFSGFR